MRRSDILPIGFVLLVFLLILESLFRTPAEVLLGLLDTVQAIVLSGLVAFIAGRIIYDAALRAYLVSQMATTDNSQARFALSQLLFRGWTDALHKKVFGPANWSGLNLSQMNLSYTDLTGVNLTDAKLMSTNFEGAWLQQSNLSGADVSFANFNKARLEGANIVGILIHENTILPNGKRYSTTHNLSKYTTK